MGHCSGLAAYVTRPVGGQLGASEPVPGAHSGELAEGGRNHLPAPLGHWAEAAGGQSCHAKARGWPTFGGSCAPDSHAGGNWERNGDGEQ